MSNTSLRTDSTMDVYDPYGLVMSSHMTMVDVLTTKAKACTSGWSALMTRMLLNTNLLKKKIEVN